MSVGVFASGPHCRAVCTSLRQTLRRVKATPKYIVCDRDSIFDCHALRRWVKRKGIQPPRYGAVGKHGTIAVIERFTLTMKNACTRRMIVPLRREAFRRECAQPWVLVAGKPGQRFDTRVTFQSKRCHLPVVTLTRAA